MPTGTLETDKAVRWMNEKHNTKINDLYRKYGDVIVGIHSGHEHMDSFRIIYNKNGKMLLVNYIHASISFIKCTCNI